MMIVVAKNNIDLNDFISAIMKTDCDKESINVLHTEFYRLTKDGETIEINKIPTTLTDYIEEQ